MGDKNYKRTTGGKNKWRRMCWMPVIRNGIAYMKDGARYQVRDDGWRRLRAS